MRVHMIHVHVHLHDMHAFNILIKIIKCNIVNCNNIIVNCNIVILFCSCYKIKLLTKPLQLKQHEIYLVLLYTIINLYLYCLNYCTFSL